MLAEGSPAQREADAAAHPDQQSRLGRRIAYFLTAFFLSAAAGYLLVGMDPWLLVGAAAAVLVVITILMRPFAGLMLYTVIFLLRPAELYPVLAPLHIERIIGIAALCGLVLLRYIQQRRLAIDGSRQTILLLLFAAAALLSVPFAYWRAHAIQSYYEILKIVVFYMLVVHLVDTPRRLRIFTWVLLLLTGYIGATAFSAYLSGDAFFAQGIDRAVAGTSIGDNPNQLGTTMATTVPLLVLLAFHRPLGLWRHLWLFGALLLTATMAVTGSRASLLGFIGGLACIWWNTRHRLLLGAVGLMLLLGGFFLLPDQYKTRYSTITQSELDGSSQARLSTWHAGLQMIIDRPIFGVGIGCFGTAHASEYSPEARRSWLEAHSLYIQVPAEVGLTGALLFFAFLVEMLRLNRRTARALRDDPRWAFERLVLSGILAGVVVLLISGIFGHSMVRRTWYIYAGLGLAVARLYASSQEETAGSET
jgi:probable O-glycosylation ligase (exosortase A-associated)